MMAAHVASYAFFIFSLLVFMTSNLNIAATFYSYMLFFLAVASTASQLLLVFIFNSICEQQIKRRTKELGRVKSLTNPRGNFDDESSDESSTDGSLNPSSFIRQPPT